MSRHLPEVLAVISLLTILFAARVSCEPVEIVLRPVDFGYMSHIEHVPRPRYIHSYLTAADIARELLLKSFYGEDLDRELLSFLIRCRRDGYYTSNPSIDKPDWEATFYTSWLFVRMGLDPGVDPARLYGVLNSSLEFTDAYYSARTLMLLGYNVSRSMLNGFDLGHAVAYIRGSKVESVDATILWLLLYPGDEAKVEWLRSRGIELGDCGGWVGIEFLMVYRPVFINATVYPRVIVSAEPGPLHVSAVRWPCEPVDYTFSWRLVNGSIVSTVRAGGRILEFRHTVARMEYAVLRMEQRVGGVVIRISYKPPYVLVLSIGGVEYSWNVTCYDFHAELELPIYGSFRVYAEVIGKDVVLRGSGVVFLETSPERKLIDLAFLLLPSISSLVSIAGSSRRKLKLTCLLIISQASPLAFYNMLLELHPIWITLAYGSAVLAITYFIDREAFSRAVSHILVLTALSATSMVVGNPIILMLGGFGAALFLVAAVLYPSELSKTERFYKSTMLLYSLGVLSMAFLNETAVSIANFMYAPDSGFIDAVRTQTMFIANLFSLTPVVAPIYHLAKLIHSYERAREAREVLRELTRF